MTPLESFVMGFLHAINVPPVVWVQIDRGGVTVFHPPMPNAQGPISLTKGIETYFKNTAGAVKLVEKSAEYIQGRRDGALSVPTTR